MKNYIPIGILLLSLFFYGCGSADNTGGGKASNGTAVKAPKKAGKAGKKNVKTPLKKKKKAQQAAPNSKSLLVISDKAGMEVGVIKLQSGYIDFGTGQLKSKKGASGKTKYTNRRGSVVAKVNTYPDEDKMKIKSEDGKLLWKLKWSDSDLTIANDEEMKNPFKLKKGADAVTIQYEGKEFGKVTSVKGTSKVAVGKTIYKINSDHSLVAGVMGIEKIPLQHRMIILREMIN